MLLHMILISCIYQALSLSLFKHAMLKSWDWPGDQAIMYIYIYRVRVRVRDIYIYIYIYIYIIKGIGEKLVYKAGHKTNNKV